MRVTIRQRLFVLTAAALVPALLAFGLNEYELRRSRAVDVTEQAIRQAHLATTELARIFEGVTELLIVTVAALDSGALSSERCDAFLEVVATTQPHLTGIAILDETGATVCGAPVDGIVPLALAAEAKATGEFVVGEYVQAGSQTTGLLPVAVPSALANGERVVAVALVRLEWLGERIRERGLMRGDALTIADRNGIIVAREPLPERFVGSRIPAPFLDLVTASAGGSREVVSQDGTRRVIGYLPATRTGGLYVSAGVSISEAFAPINRATATAAIFMLCGASIAFGFAWFVGQSVIQRPVDRLLTVAKAWQTGDLNVRAGLPQGPGEFETVGLALDTMMDALQQRDVERQRASEQRQLLSRELSHRVKNNLALVQAIASQTFGDGDRERYRRYSERLIALAGSYDLLLADEWAGSDLRETIEAAVRPHRSGEDKRFRMEGPGVHLQPQAVVALSLVIHELATNAVKYGALSHKAGWVEIAWRLVQSSPSRVEISWSEHNGPVVSPPTREGFGTRLMRRALPSEWRPQVQIDYVAEGVRVALEFDLTEIIELSDN